jgi:hypothetical protein
MRRAPSGVIVNWTSVLSVLLALFSFASLAFAQTRGVSKRKLSNDHLPLSERPLAGVTAAGAAKPNAPPPTTTAAWTGSGGDNNWGTSTNWNPNGVPNSSTVLVTIGTTTAHVNLNINATVDTLTLSNSGDVLGINNNQNLTVDGNITNNGQINLNSGGNLTELIIAASGITLSGTGTLNMSNNPNNVIFGAAAADKLTNQQTIQGAGNIGNGQMALANSGTIDATQTNNLIIQTSNGDTNTGTLEATTGILVLQGDTITNTGGTIKSTGSAVQLNGVTVSGGTLTTTGSGLVHTVSGQTATLKNLTNSGSYQVDNNGITNLIGTITNNGNLNLASGGNATELVINGNVTLSGTGALTMSNNPNNFIFGSAAANVLTVGSGQTISGAGDIGNNQMALVNNGVIDANQTNALTIDTSNGTTNNKTLEATGGGTLILFGRAANTITNTGGTISAAASSVVDLQNGIVINGGTITTSGSGLIHTQSGQSGTLENLTNTGNYQLDNNSTTTLVGTITNNGNINLASGGNVTQLLLSGNVTLSGSGTLTMSNNPENFIYGASLTGTEVLTNNITISGSGNIGKGLMVLNNTSLGTIDANQSNILNISPSAGGATNTGLLEATSGGTLALNSGTYTNAVGSTQGTILANGGTVNLEPGANIVGGTLKSQNGGVIQNVGNAATLDGSTSTGAVTLVTGSSLVVLNNTVLSVKGSIVNNGTMTLSSGGSNTELEVTGTSATLSGTGTLTMSNNSQNFIFGAVAADTFTNQETIQGSGNIGAGQMVFVNSGTVNANQSNALAIQTSGGTTNTGTLEATAGGTLLLDGISGGNITNTGGTIQANGASGTGNGAAVNLRDGITITGGTITSNSFGSFSVLAGGATLSGLTNTGTVNIVNNDVLNLAGTIVNNGAINLNSGGNNTELILSGNVALNGTGTVTMSNNPQNFIFGGVAADVLTVASTQTIQGAGNIGNGQMVLVNNGTINANVSNALTINVSGGTSNTGTLEASSGGALSLFGGTVTNTGKGKVVANTGGTVFLRSNVIVSGGSLTGGGTFIEDGSSGGATLSRLTNASTVLVNNNTALTLAGTITNTGSIQENSGGNVTEILLSGNVTLSGTGTLSMSNNPENFIFSSSGSTDILTNASTIQGSGNIGNGLMGLVNSGTINANQSNTLFIDVSSANFNNTGTIEATSSGGLVVEGPANSFLNYSSGTNTLTGGTYIANGGNVTLPLGSSGGIATLSAKVTEEGGSQILNSNNSNANGLNGLTSITSTGALTIGGVAFTDTGSFSNAGSLTILGGESFTVGSLTQISGGSLTAGTYVLDANLNLSGTAQTITANAATLTLAGGTIHNNSGSTNALAGLATNTGKLTIGGASNNVSTTAASFSNAGTLTINAGDSFTAAKLTQISGSTLSGGTFVLGGNLDLTTSGINITTNSSTLTLQGGTIMSGATNALANLNTNSKSLTLAGSANFTTTGNFTNSGTMTINGGSTFAVISSGNLTNYHSTTKTLTGGTYTVGGTLSAAGLNIVIDAANITLNGTGKLVNSTSSANALGNLNTIASTGSLTLASNANFSTVGSFSNSGTLTVNKGSQFTVTTGTLTNLSGGTLTGGTYTVGGTMQLPSANGGIASNAANLTLTGSSAKILDGTSNALAGFNNNTGTLTLASAATLTTSASNFSNSGTVVVSRGTTLTVGGTNNSYAQTAGTTTVDGTLMDAGTGAIIVTGGTIQGAGTLKANVSIGGGATINVGDAGRAGLLKITGTYTQLSTGTMNVSIGGTTVGTQFSQLKITGVASLGGTLTAALVNGFTPTVGQTFTVLTASSVAGTFSNSTIAINSTEHFAVSYTSTGVVLTAASGPGSKSASTPLISQMVAAGTKRAIASAKPPVLSSGLKYKIGGTVKAVKPVLVAGLRRPGGSSNEIVAHWSERYDLGVHNRTPIVTRWDHADLQRVAQPQRNLPFVRHSLPVHNDRVSARRGIGSRPVTGGWLSAPAGHLMPVARMPMPSLLRMR